MYKLYLLVLCLSVLVTLSQCLNILVVYEIILPSHFYTFKNLFRTLAETGHNVTIMTFFPQDKSIPNYRHIDLRDKDGVPLLRIANIEQIKPPKQEMYGTAHLVSEMAEKSCEAFVKNPVVHSFLRENNSYDLVIREVFHSNCHNGLIKKFKAPVIGLSTCISLPWMNPMYGTPDNPAYVPDTFLDHSDRMNFLDRVENTVMLAFHKLMYEILMKRPGNELSKKYFGEDVVTEEDMDYTTSLLLSNTHFTFTRPRPLPPNVIEVAGIHIGEGKPLPKNIEKYINESPHGVVYMSMGSMLKGVSFPREKRMNFMNAISKIKQRVIWKWESGTMEGKPDNVLLLKWSPQKELLCHPNVKAFISHGGLLGTLEAFHCGVPMLVIPQFGDQHNNAAFVVENGFGIKMYLSEASAENILENLKTILTEPYMKQAKEVSRRFRDRPLPPMETAIYWINYVAKHGGAKFMRTAAVDMPFYQYFLLDVIAFILFVIFTILFIGYKIVMFVLFTLLIKKASPMKMKRS